MNLRVLAAVRFFALGSLIWVASGCANYFHQPTKARRARLGEDTPITSDLRNLPATKEKVVAAVYKFRDLTGQYRQTEVGTGFSTAITQGTTNILLKALEESGWFVPIERENVSNLLNERKIVRSSVAQFKEGENLPPLLFAGIILEGGVVSYDANIMTGGGGVRYFGAGSSTKYRQDRVTVYLRAVATKSGKILKTIYTSKTLLSQTIDASLFRYVTFKRLLEAETGITTTEPGQMVVTEAIEKAVYGLIIEGAKDGLWAAADTASASMKRVMDEYEKDKQVMSETDVYSVRRERDAPRVSLQPYVGVWQYSGDYARKTPRLGYGLSADVFLTPQFGLQLNAGISALESQGAFSTNIGTLEGNLLFKPLPNQRWTPLLFAGGGIISRRGSGPTEFRGSTYYQVNGGLGVQYLANQTIGFRSTISMNQLLTDEIDGKVFGARNDYYLRGSLGLVINLGRFGRKARPVTKAAKPVVPARPAAARPAATKPVARPAATPPRK
ncbi:MAG: CsgG/HfaB family protein [Spirosoma sp.]|nr:CsgG/HfaB family protein [Spirosoma sp.]